MLTGGCIIFPITTGFGCKRSAEIFYWMLLVRANMMNGASEICSCYDAAALSQCYSTRVLSFYLLLLHEMHCTTTTNISHIMMIFLRRIFLVRPSSDGWSVLPPPKKKYGVSASTVPLLPFLFILDPYFHAIF